MRERSQENQTDGENVGLLRKYMVDIIGEEPLREAIDLWEDPRWGIEDPEDEFQIQDLILMMLQRLRDRDKIQIIREMGFSDIDESLDRGGIYEDDTDEGTDGGWEPEEGYRSKEYNEVKTGKERTEVEKFQDREGSQQGEKYESRTTWNFDRRTISDEATTRGTEEGTREQLESHHTKRDGRREEERPGGVSMKRRKTIEEHMKNWPCVR